MSLISSMKNIIESVIQQIERDYQSAQGLILTESDLKCLIFSKLRNRIISQFHKYITSSRRNEAHNTYSHHVRWKMRTRDPGIYSSPLHTELAWYDENHRLTIKPDITILDPSGLSILHGFASPRLPSKQYAFRGEAILLELKFIRNRKGIGVKTLEAIMKDFAKIQRLEAKLSSEQMGDKFFCYFVIFNKTDIVCNEFEMFIKNNRDGPWHKIIYATGQVTF